MVQVQRQFRHNHWIIVADGRKAHILSPNGAGTAFETVWQVEVGLDPTRGIVTDRPGRTHDRQGPGRHAMEAGVDYHRQQKERFVRGIADFINTAIARSEVASLTLIAPPAALGDLRAALSDAARTLVVDERSEDLTNLSRHDLQGRLHKLIS